MTTEESSQQTLMSDRKTVEIFTCSKCGKPNSRDPSNCCIGGDFRGNRIKVVIPKLRGQFVTNYFGEDKIMNQSQLEKFFITCVYANQQYKIGQCLNTLIAIKTLRREDKVHDARCEYAIGNSCVCWCGEKYHGWKGRDL